MKKFLLISGLLIITICNYNTLKATDCYNKYNLGCQNWAPVNYVSVDVILDEFPNCTLHVNYTIRFCITDPSKVQMNITDFWQGMNK